MTNEILKKATIKLGEIEFEGLQNEVGQYFISASQIAHLFGYHPKHINRGLKRALGEGFSSTRVRTDLDKKDILVLPYLSLIDIIKHGLSIGNKQALIINNSLLGLSLKTLFDDSFGVETTKDDRQEWLKAFQLAEAKHKRLVTTGIKYLNMSSQKDKAKIIGEFHKRLCGKPSFGKKEEKSESELDDYNRKAQLTIMYIESGYDLEKALDKVFN